MAAASLFCCPPACLQTRMLSSCSWCTPTTSGSRCSWTTSSTRWVAGCAGTTFCGCGWTDGAGPRLQQSGRHGHTRGASQRAPHQSKPSCAPVLPDTCLPLWLPGLPQVEEIHLSFTVLMNSNNGRVWCVQHTHRLLRPLPLVVGLPPGHPIGPSSAIWLATGGCPPLPACLTDVHACLPALWYPTAGTPTRRSAFSPLSTSPPQATRGRRSRWAGGCLRGGEQRRC